MSNGDDYTCSQRVIDMDSTVYESILVTDEGSVYDVGHLYQCFVQCMFDDLGMSLNHADLVTVTGESGQGIAHKTKICQVNSLTFLLLQFQEPVFLLLFRTPQVRVPQIKLNLISQSDLISTSCVSTTFPSITSIGSIKKFPNANINSSPLLAQPTMAFTASFDLQPTITNETSSEHWLLTYLLQGW